ncbi:MAG: hypothetical protein ACOC92_00585 [bacterium]
MPRARALMDLLPWDLVVADGLVANADGALTASFSFRGPDPASSTPQELLALSRNLVQAFRGLGDGWLLHVDLHRSPAPDYPPPGAFTDPFTRALDQDRRRAYRRRKSHFLSQQFLSLTFHPGVGGERRSPLDTLLQPDIDAATLDDQIRDFEAALEEIVGILSAVLRLRRLPTRAMLEYFSRCLTGRRQPLNIPRDTPYTFEHLFGAGNLYGGTNLRFAETHIVPIRFSGFPEELAAGALDFLNDLPLAFRFCCRYIPMDPHTARTAIKRKRAAWNTAGVGWRQALAALFGSRDSEPAFTERFAPEMARDADDALLELETAQVSAGYLTPVFFTASPDREEAQRLARRLLKHLRNAGYDAAIEDLNALDAYLGALPGLGRSNVRRPLMTLGGAANFLPATSVWAGEPRHPHFTEHPPTIMAATNGSTPFAFSSAVGDVQHAAIIGPTGAGKSVFLNLLLAQYFRYPAAQVASLDKGYSQLALALAAGGAHYDLSSDTDHDETPNRFAPLQHLSSRADFQRSAEWVLALLEIARLEPTPTLQRTVTAALRDLQHATHRNLATFAIKVQSHAIRDALDPYILDGPYASLFDGASSPIRRNRFSVFEMENLLPLREAAVVPAVLHLFGEVERRLDGSPTLIAVEELAGYLHRELFAKRFTQYLLEFRKKNAGLIMVNQNVTALLDSPLRSALLENTPTKIFLPNPAATEPSVAEAYRAVGLNDRQIEILATATPRHDYYVSTPLGARLFHLDLSPAALAILGLAGPVARQTVDEARETWGDEWLPRYLEDLGHDDFAQLLESPA